jgi:hypothetical protein
MSNGSIGPLVKADEFFNHQIVDTFATVSQSDYSWTEKVCGMAAARDGSLQVGFGFGKYPNRNVVDAYGGVGRQREQWTVRASRELARDPDTINAGPLEYEVIEPLKRIRIALAATDVQPIAWELELEGVVPCMLEDREDRRNLHGFRHTASQIRYHQTGTARGWVEVEGKRTEVRPSEWIMTRDHSWGIRPDVGVRIPDLGPDPMDGRVPSALAIWNPLLFQRPDGSSYAFHQYYLNYSGPGFRHERIQGGYEHADGRREPLVGMSPHLRFDPVTLRLLGGEFRVRMADGSERLLTAEAVSDTGFHLGAGLYHGFDGKHHGSWMGPLNVEGEYFADCTAPESLARLNQFRDCMIRVHDHHTGATGWGNCQTYVLGRWPEFGLP